jgi:DNA-binding NtrC family response regulator
METRRNGELTGLRVATETKEQATSTPAPFLESHNAAMALLLDRIRRASLSDANILLLGESGTGKDVIARQIHRWSVRGTGPFVGISCIAHQTQLLESDLFGHVRGAFAGAVTDRAGRLEGAAGGTIFLDEIADLPPPMQIRFLRFLEEQTFERVGGSRTIHVNARILAASSHDLQVETAAGHFRADLYYRLGVITFWLPPLYKRAEDVIPMAQSFLRQACARLNRPLLELSPEASALLSSYRWPGNVRELRNAIECAASLAATDVVSANDLPETVRGAEVSIPAIQQEASHLREVEYQQIVRVMAESATLAEAAGKLGINVTTLWRKRKRYGLRSPHEFR